MDTLVGKMIDHYQIISLLGQGGMAAVYKAWDTTTNRHIAVKVLASPLASNLDFVERFHREAKAAQRLNHPNIVRVHAVGKQGDLHYLVMDYIEGETLQRRLEREKRLSVQVAAGIVDQIGAALDHAHSQGLIHRDVKPSNILLDDQGRAYLSDFGIAKAVAGTKLTRTGTSLGTPEYMSPEQVMGKTLDGRSDLYALGIVLYEMLTGQVPFTAETAASVLYRHVYTPPPMVTFINPHLPHYVNQVAQKALAKDPRERYPSGQEMGVALRQGEFAATQMVERPARRPVSPFAIAAGVIALVLVALLIVVMMTRGAPSQVALVTPTTVAATATTVVVTETTRAPMATSMPTTATLRLSPSPTPAPTPSHFDLIIAAITNRTPDFQDDFSSDQGWRIAYGNGGIEIRDGVLRVTVPSRSVVVSNPKLTGKDYVFQADARMAKDDQTSNLLFEFRDVATGYFYTLFLSERQTWRISKIWGNSTSELVSGREGFDALGMTRVMVITRGDQVAVYLNGKPVAVAQDPDLDNAGAIDLGGQANADGVFEFDNVRFWDLANVPNLPALTTAQARATTPTATKTLSPIEQGVKLDYCRSDICIYPYRGSGTPIGLSPAFTNFMGASWSPDGTQFVFGACTKDDAARWGCNDIYTANRDGGNVTGLVVNTSTHDHYPTWSPDGGLIAFHQNGSLKTIRADRSEVRTLTTDSNSMCPNGIAWSPDSNQIAWIGGICSPALNRMDRVWVANRDGSQMRTVFLSSEMQLGTGSIGQIAWSPDGKSVAVAMETGIVYLIDVNCAAGSTGCDASSRKRIDAIPVHWLPNFYPQWAGEKVAR